MPTPSYAYATKTCYSEHNTTLYILLTLFLNQILWLPAVIHMCLCHLGYHPHLQRLLSRLSLSLPSLDYLTVAPLQKDLFDHMLQYLKLIDPLVPQEVSYFDHFIYCSCTFTSGSNKH